MATADQIKTVRKFINDPAGTDQFLDDDFIGDLIDGQEGDLNAAASDLWKVKAARVSEWYLVNIDGAFMSRGEAFDHAMKMSEVYGKAGTMSNIPLITRAESTETPEY